jgi:transposase-like protein
MMEGMSAANAVVDNNDAALAAMRNLTLRIGSVLLAGEADKESLTSKNPRREPSHQNLKRRLTLIFKVDNR